MTAVPVLGDSSTEDSSEADVPGVDPAVNTTATEEACSPNVVEILLANEGNDLLTAYNATLALPEYAAAAEDNAENNPNFTLYAPTDAAVEALAGRLGVEPEALLGADYLDTTAEIVWYHSVSDGGCGLDDAVTDCPALVAGGVVVGACNNASVVAGPFEDCVAGSGIIYMIDGVLLPPSLCGELLGGGESVDANATCSPTVFEILIANDGSDLLAAYNATLALPQYAAAAEVNAANNGNWTLFAPTDSAIAEFASQLGVPGPAALLGAQYLNTTAEIVWYHSVSDGGCGLDDAVTDCPALVAGDVVVGACNNASVVAGPFADCLAENGEVYLISEVLLPPALCNGTVIEAETLL